MRQLRCTKGLLVGLFIMLLLTAESMVVAAYAGQTTSALTADQAITCIQTAVSAQAGLVKEVEAEDKGGQRLCEVKIVDEMGKRHKLHIDVATNQVVKSK
jgi:hypothetical protein